MPDDLDGLFREYHVDLQRLARRRLRDRESAADLVQESFLRFAAMARDCGQAAAIENPRWFLRRIVANLAIDASRRDRRRGEHASLDEVADRLPDLRPAPDEAIELREQIAILRAAVGDLPPKCRAALLLNRIDGLSHAEVARRLGVSASMVSKYVMQAVRHCARRLGLPRG